MGREAQTELGRGRPSGSLSPTSCSAPCAQPRGEEGAVTSLLTPGSCERALMARGSRYTRGQNRDLRSGQGPQEEESKGQGWCLGVLLRVCPACVLSLSWEVCFVHELP